MAAYGAVSSLKQTMARLVNYSTISIPGPSLEILESSYGSIKSLQKYLERLTSGSGKRANAVRAQIREAACKLEDAILSHVSDQFLSQTENQINIGADRIVTVDMEEVRQEVCSFSENVKRIEEENRIEDLLAEEEDDISLRTDFGGKCSKMVGFSDLFREIKHDLITYRKLTYKKDGSLYSVLLYGMAGIGKTFLAMKIFEDPEILSHFELRAFVTIGPKYKFKDVMLGILAQLTPDIHEIHNKGVEEVGLYLCETLRNRRYLIVLDYVWDGSISELLQYLPDDGKWSRFLVTTRVRALHLSGVVTTTRQMPLLNNEESWNLLCDRVFGEENLCPFQLEKYGKKIAEYCEGLPLTIVTVAGILSKNDKMPEYWKQTAEVKNSVFTDAYDLMFESLFQSYKYLSEYLKPCFLCMGVFPPKWKITTSRIFKLFSAEGFLRPSSLHDSEHFARECLGRLIDSSLVLVDQQISRFRGLPNYWTLDSAAKTWSLHSALWHMCNKQAGTEKFFHLIKSYPSSIATEVIKGQQRLCIQNNALFGIKDVCNSMESISSVRSLLCTGPHHQYPVRICFGLRFLRVLDALTVRFYKFPIEVLKLVQLRYLALTCNGNIPASISKLWSLEYFFVRRHLSIKPSGGWPHLPMEIWNMTELRHLQVMGSNLPHHCGAVLPNLLTLTDMSADSCTAEILGGTPNLKKLGIQIELPPEAAGPMCFFDHLSHLHRLESLKCIIVNPMPRSPVVSFPTAFPSSLRKLNLSGFGYPWEYMSTIAQLPNLEVLKLKRYAFQGPKWETQGEFLKLTGLLIEETDLVHWVANSSCFPRLLHLMVTHCYKLKVIPSGFGDIPYLRVNLVDCPSAVHSVRHVQEQYACQFSIQSSWEDGKLKS